MNSNPTNPTNPTSERHPGRGGLRIFLFILAALITLLALWHAEENWRGSHAWNSYKRQRVAAGESFDAAGVIPARVPDDQNFAMTPFFAPLFDFVPGTQTQRDHKAVDHTMTYFDELPAGWNSSNETDLVAIANELLHPKKEPANNTPAVADPKDAARVILQKFEKYSPVVEELRAASQRPYARFNVAYDSPDKIAIILPHLAVLRNAGRMLTMRALAELALDQTNEAFADTALGLYLPETVKTEPIVVSQLVRQTALNMALQPVIVGIKEHKWSEAQLEKLQARLSEIDLVTGLKTSLDGESKFFVDVGLDDLKAHSNRLKVINHWQTLMSDHGPAESSNPLVQFLFFLAVPRGWVDFEQLNYQKTFVDKMLTAIDLPNHSFDPDIAAEADLYMMRTRARGRWSCAIHHQIVATLMLPSFHRLSQKTAWIQAQVNMTQIACALERYRLVNGQFPDDIATLTPRFLTALPNDPIKGGPLKYHRNDATFLIYSIGWNGKDDGGKLATTNGKSSSADVNEGDWLWGSPVSFSAAHDKRSI